MLFHKFLSTSLLLVLFYCSVPAQCGIYKMMAEAMLHHMSSGWNDGWESKGVSFGLKSKGMTAIIPVPLPIPVFTKDKGGGKGGGNGGNNNGNGGNGNGGNNGGGGGQKIKYIPVPIPQGGKEDWWR